MLLLRTIGWISWIFLYLFYCLPAYGKAKRLQKKGQQAEFEAVVENRVQGWAASLLRHIKVGVEIEGAENLPQNGETVVFAANHQSFLDIPILLSCLDKPHGIMAKKEIGKIPLLRDWMTLLGCVYVDRDDVRSSIAALKAAEATVKSGKSYIVFPEGTRTKDGGLNEFKAGAVRIAYKNKVPVVPVAIDGSYKLLEANGFRLKKGSVKLTILPGIATAGLTRDEQKALPGRLEAAVAGALGVALPATGKGGEAPAGM